MGGFVLSLLVRLLLRGLPHAGVAVVSALDVAPRPPRPNWAVGSPAALLSVRRLRSRLQERGLPSSGPKAELVRRLEADWLGLMLVDPSAQLSSEIDDPSPTLLEEFLAPPEGAGTAERFPLKALRLGQELQGIVTNLCHDGAWVDVGAERDGFVHISQLSDNDIVDVVRDHVSLEQEVTVWVSQLLGADKFMLSMAKRKLRLRTTSQSKQISPNDLPHGKWLLGVVSHVADYGLFVIVEQGGAQFEGLVHASKLPACATYSPLGRAPHPCDVAEVGQEVQVRVLGARGGKLSFSMLEDT